MLNEHFVAIEFNATDFGGVPDDVPAMAVLNKTWDESPYCRVAFRSEWVISSDGKYVLGVTPCNHNAAKEESVDFGASFERLIEDSLTRLARIRAYPAGSDEAREEAERVHAEALVQLKEIKPCWLDKDVMTEHYIKTVLAQGEDQEAFERRYCQLFGFVEPEVRRIAVDNLGIYAKSAPFTFAERLPYLSDQSALLLEDPDPSVRQAAAEALYSYQRKAVPEGLEGSELVASAGEMWWSDRVRPVAEDEEIVEGKLPTVWPVQPER